MLADFDEITWSLHVLFGPGQTPYFTWAESNANEGEQRVFHLHSIRLMWSTAFEPGLIEQNWLHHFGERTWYLQVWCLRLWSLRIVNCWLEQIYFHLLFSPHRWWWNLMASFDRKEHIVIGARTWFEGFDRWHFLKTEFFLVSALLTEFDGLRENKEVLYLLFTRDHY